MNRILATVVFLLSFGLLIGLQMRSTSTISRTQGFVIEQQGEEIIRIEGEHVFRVSPDDQLRRGTVIKTGNSRVLIAYESNLIALAERTEIQLTKPGEIKLLGGRIVISEPITVRTSWINVHSETLLSVVNYAWKREVQILPMGAIAIVENSSLNEREFSFPTTWSEDTKELSVSEEPFNAETSSEADFYNWAQERL